MIAASEPEAIVALGAIPYATDRPDRDGSGLPFDTTMRVNVLGLYYLLTAAAEAGVKKLVHTSSVVTMKGGATTYRYLPIDDDHPGCVTESYIFSKMAGEMMLQWFWRAYGIHSVGCRPAWIWTPASENMQRHTRRTSHRLPPHHAGAADHRVGVGALARNWSAPTSTSATWLPRPPTPPVDALDRLPPAECYYAGAADHRAPEESRELIERLRPELVGAIPD